MGEHASRQTRRGGHLAHPRGTPAENVPRAAKRAATGPVGAAKPVAAQAPLYQQLAAEEARYGRFTAGQQQRSADLTHGWLDELAGQPAQLAAIYGQAGQQVSGLAQAAADRLHAANPGAQINTLLQS